MALRLGPPGSAERPARFLLEQNYPNPFNPTTRFQYTVAAAGLVTLKMYDALGREVATIVDEVKQPGVYQAEWDARSFPSGVYTCRMQAGSFSNSKKVVFLR
jgi:flagellar hook assembly protein FlgD